MPSSPKSTCSVPAAPACEPQREAIGAAAGADGERVVGDRGRVGCGGIPRDPDERRGGEADGHAGHGEPATDVAVGGVDHLESLSWCADATWRPSPSPYDRDPSPVRRTARWPPRTAARSVMAMWRWRRGLERARQGVLIIGQ